MKRTIYILAALLAAAPIVRAEKNKLEKIGPGVVTGGTVTIAAPGARKRNCITDLTSSATSYIITRALTGTATFYEVVSSSGVAVPEHWAQDAPLCGDVNTALILKSSLMGPSLGGTVGLDTAAKISYSGYISEE